MSIKDDFSGSLMCVSVCSNNRSVSPEQTIWSQATEVLRRWFLVLGSWIVGLVRSHPLGLDCAYGLKPIAVKLGSTMLFSRDKWVPLAA